jgi:hypothetical protein
MITAAVLRVATQWTTVALSTASVLSCGRNPTFQVLYGGTVPVEGLTVTVTQDGRRSTIKGSDFTTDAGLGILHSIPSELPHTGPTQVLIQLADPESAPVAEGSLTFDAAPGTPHQMTLLYLSRRPICVPGCPPNGIFPSLVPGSPDTLFVVLGSSRSDGGVSRRGPEESLTGRKGLAVLVGRRR